MDPLLVLLDRVGGVPFGALLLDLGTRCVGVDWDSTSRFAVFYFKDWVWSPGQPSLFYDYISAWSSPQPNPLFK
jgi:hypothetical protein